MNKELERKKREKKEKAATRKRHWVRLTRMCNNNCIFCLDKDAQNGTFLPLSSIRKNLQQGREQHIDQVVLSGGEATIHPQFLEAVKMAKKMGYKHIQVITNGRMFAYNDFLLASLSAGVNEITFSIHGHNDELHDKLTGIKGSFRQAMAGLRNALEIPGLIVNQDIVINKQNCEQLDEIVEYFITSGIREFDLLQIIPFGRAWEKRDELFYDMKRAMPRIKKTLAFSRRPDVYIWTNRFPPKYLEGFEELIQHPDKLYDEINGRRDMFEAYLKKGKMMECRGERCGYCSLEKFCLELIEFGRTGKLISKSDPACLGRKRVVKKPSIFSKHSQSGIFEFLDFFIKYRYFLKGEKCQICSSNSQCDGAHINYIRENGFKSLKPMPSNFAPLASAYLDLSEFSRCNLKCIFCSGEFHQKTKKENLAQNYTKSLKANLLFICKQLNRKNLSIGGGEPLECAGLTELIKYAKRIGYKQITLQTNGTKLANPKLAEEIVRLGVSVIQMPVYGHNAGIHDLITGTKGSFRNTLKAIHNLKCYPKLKVCVHTILLKQNYLYVKDIYDLVVKDLGLSQLILKQVLPRNMDKGDHMDKDDYKRVCPTYSELRQVLKNEVMPSADYKLPACLLNNSDAAKFCTKKAISKNKERIEAIRISKEEVSLRDAEKGWVSAERMGKTAKCKKCKATLECQGVPALYLDIYGDKELEPISKEDKACVIKKIK